VTRKGKFESKHRDPLIGALFVQLASWQLAMGPELDGYLLFVLLTYYLNNPPR